MHYGYDRNRSLRGARPSSPRSHAFFFLEGGFSQLPLPASISHSGAAVSQFSLNGKQAERSAAKHLQRLIVAPAPGGALFELKPLQQRQLSLKLGENST